MLDLVLAIIHHLLAFGLAAVLAAEFVLVTPRMSIIELHKAAAVDRFYGVMAALIVVIGFARAIFAAKGWEYYSINVFFWAKIVAFVLVGLLSVLPTMRLVAWKNAENRSPGTMPTPADISALRRYLKLEVLVFALIPVFAALMARGYGE
jgi:putative membrane protein